MIITILLIIGLALTARKWFQIILLIPLIPFLPFLLAHVFGKDNPSAWKTVKILWGVAYFLLFIIWILVP